MGFDPCPSFNLKRACFFWIFCITSCRARLQILIAGLFRRRCSLAGIPPAQENDIFSQDLVPEVLPAGRKHRGLRCQYTDPLPG